MRKIADVPPMLGLFVEIPILTPVALGYLVYLSARGDGAFGAGNPGPGLLLVAAGPVTVFPLLLFADGIRKLTLATVGFLQCLAPTGHFILAVAVFEAPFDTGHLLAFACIYTARLRRRHGGRSRPPPAPLCT